MSDEQFLILVGALLAVALIRPGLSEIYVALGLLLGLTSLILAILLALD